MLFVMFRLLLGRLDLFFLELVINLFGCEGVVGWDYVLGLGIEI